VSEFGWLDLCFSLTATAFPWPLFPLLSSILGTRDLHFDNSPHRRCSARCQPRTDLSDIALASRPIAAPACLLSIAHQTQCLRLLECRRVHAIRVHHARSRVITLKRSTHHGMPRVAIAPAPQLSRCCIMSLDSTKLLVTTTSPESPNAAPQYIHSTKRTKPRNCLAAALERRAVQQKRGPSVTAVANPKKLRFHSVLHPQPTMRHLPPSFRVRQIVSKSAFGRQQAEQRDCCTSGSRSRSLIDGVSDHNANASTYHRQDQLGNPA